MGENILKRHQQLLWLLALAFLLLSLGCYGQRASVPDEKSPVTGITKIAVIGFRPAVTQGKKPDAVREPFSGKLIMASPVSPDVAEKLSDILFDRLVDEKKYELISPDQAMGVLSRIVDSDQNVGMDTVKIFQEVGKAFGCDAVLAGLIYRWREREGTAIGVNRAASVAFDLRLVRPSDGAILWRAKFDKTQRSLTENLFEAGTFFQGGGVWMTAEKLGMIGLNKILAEMPGGIKGKED